MATLHAFISMTARCCSITISRSNISYANALRCCVTRRLSILFIFKVILAYILSGKFGKRCYGCVWIYAVWCSEWFSQLIVTGRDARTRISVPVKRSENCKTVFQCEYVLMLLVLPQLKLQVTGWWLTLKG